MTRTVGIKLVMLALLIGTVAAVVIGLRGPSFKNLPQRMPDGSVWTLVQADFGKETLPLSDSFFDRLRRKYVSPAGIKFRGREWIAPLPPVLRGIRTNAAHELIFWIRHDLGTNAPVLWGAMENDLRQNSRVVLFDDQGNENVGIPGSVLHSGVPPNVPQTNYVGQWRIPVFPRHGATVGIKILRRSASGQWNAAAEFKIANPSPAAPGRWPADVLPKKVTQGNMEFTLKTLETLSPGGEQGEVTLNAQANFGITVDGRPTDEWQPDFVTLSDITGNRFRTAVFAGTNSPVTYRFWNSLDAGDVWKMTVSFSRVKNFSSNEVRQMTLPRKEGWRPQIFTFKPSDSQETTVTARIMRTGPDVEHVAFSPPTNPATRIKILSIKDDSGAEIPPRTNSAGLSGRMWEFRLPPQVKAVVATFAVHESLEVEFLARPVVKPANNSFGAAVPPK